MRTACRPRSAAAPSFHRPGERGSATRSQLKQQRPGAIRTAAIHRLQAGSGHAGIPL